MPPVGLQGLGRRIRAVVDSLSVVEVAAVIPSVSVARACCFALAVSLSATWLQAQCLQAAGWSIVPLLVPTSALPSHDEGLSVDLPFPGFAFPIGGAYYTHFVVSSNGEVYLTNGGGVTDPAQFGVSMLAELRGSPGASPRVMALSGDLVASLGTPSWDILVDDAHPGRVQITWHGVRTWFSWPTFSMGVTLFSSGEVRLHYGAGDFQHVGFGHYAGISAGDAVGTGLETASDFTSLQDSGAKPLLFDADWQPFDLPDRSVLLQPNGSGGYRSEVVCGESFHDGFGEGCHGVGRESFYQHFTDAGVAANVLTGNAMVLTPVTGGYGVVWLANAAVPIYLPPSAAAVALDVGNDGQVTQALPTPFVVSGQSITDLTVQGNGIIGFGLPPVGPWSQNWLPEPARMLAGSHGGVYCWHAYNADEGGQVWFEDVGTISCVTFEDVENFPLSANNPSTFQIQFHHLTGEILFVFVHIDADNSPVLTSYPQDHLIGFTPPGPSIDPGGIDFLVDLPLQTMPDVEPLRLSASPDPVSTTTSGTSVTYRVEHAIEWASGAGLVIGVVAFSLALTPPLDLGPLGAPGCAAHVGSFGWTLSFVGPPGPNDVVLDVPAGVPPGLQVFAQAAALSPGANAAGLITSNAVASTIAGN